MKSGLIQRKVGAGEPEENAGTRDVWRSENGTGEQAEEDHMTAERQQPDCKALQPH